MAGTETDLANAALAMVREDPITDINDPDDNRAKEAKRLWETLVRGSVLRGADWNSVRKELSLNEDTSFTAVEWSHAFVLPSDCIAARRLAIIDTGSPYAEKFQPAPSDFEIRGRLLLTHESTAILIYTYRETNPGVYDDLLFDACATRLAANLAFSRVGNFKLGEQLWGEYMLKIKEAEGANQIEGVGSRTMYTPSGIIAARRSW